MKLQCIIYVIAIVMTFSSCSDEGCDYSFKKEEINNLGLKMYNNDFAEILQENPKLKGRILLIYYYPYIDKRVKVPDVAKFYCDLNQKLPDSLRFSGDFNNLGTIVFYKDNISKKVGNYSDGSEARVNTCTLYFLDVASSNIIHSISFEGGSPPKNASKPRRGKKLNAHYGSFTDKNQIIDYILGLHAPEDYLNETNEKQENTLFLSKKINVDKFRDSGFQIFESENFVVKNKYTFELENSSEGDESTFPYTTYVAYKNKGDYENGAIFRIKIDNIEADYKNIDRKDYPKNTKSFMDDYKKNLADYNLDYSYYTVDEEEAILYEMNQQDPNSGNVIKQSAAFFVHERKSYYVQITSSKYQEKELKMILNNIKYIK
jgi:hypothetical protein